MVKVNQSFAEKKLCDVWSRATNPADPKWRHQWAEVAVSAGLPCADEQRSASDVHGEIGIKNRTWARLRSADAVIARRPAEHNRDGRSRSHAAVPAWWEQCVGPALLELTAREVTS